MSIVISQFLPRRNASHRTILCRTVMILLAVFATAALAFWSSSSSIRLPAKSQGLEFHLDTASFRAAEGKTHQEFYYQIPFSQLAFAKSEAGFQAEFKISATLTDDNGTTVHQQEWPQKLTSTSLEEIGGHALPGQFNVALEPGEYRLRMEITDANSGKQGVAELSFEARDFSKPELCLSDLQLSTSIQPDTSSAAFVKNGFNILPHSTRAYGKTSPLLYFYFEIYNLSTPADSFEVHYLISNRSGKVLRRMPTKRALAQGSSSVEVGGLNVASFADSVLILQVEAKELNSARAASTECAFFKTMELPPAISEAEQRIQSFSKDELKAHIDRIQYLLRDEDKKMLHDLEPPAQKSFLAQFWKQLDPNPQTPQHEYWKEYFARIDYANEHFTSGFTQGWKTDRGRVVIKFGIPNEVERFPTQTNSKPYEVWQYYQDGRKQFIFADIDGLGKYELIFSSDERELTRPDWKEIIDAR